jgi:aspartate racemase
MRVIGMIGGLSWVSTSHYYQLINADVAERLGGDHCARLVMWQHDFAEITELQRAGKWHEAGEILASGARVLRDCGAEVIGIGANTMHLVADQVSAAAAPARLVHIVEAVRDECIRLGVRRLGLLGTAYTMESAALYPPALAAAGIEVVVPNEADRATIQRHTFEELIRDTVTDECRANFRSISANLIDRGADAIVLACTEHGMVMRNGDVAVPVLDSTELHARALVDAALAG